MNRKRLPSFIIPSLLATVLVASAVPLHAAPCTGNINGSILPNCRNLLAAMSLLPCGITNIAECDLFVDDDPPDCGFEIGQLGSSNYILVDWDVRADKNPPTVGQCTALANSVDPCGGWDPLIDCPSILVSDEGCDPDTPLCFSGLQGPASPEAEAAWGESCHAYALMPRGWDEWTAARGFFVVGRTFPVEGTAWEGAADGELYGAEQALFEDLLGPTLLGIVSGRSPLWGGGKDGQVQTDRRALRRAGLCANPQGALLASPHWSTPNAGVTNFPVLARCDGTGAEGLSLYVGRDMETGEPLDATGWQESGALAADVLARLRQLEDRGRYEVVCVTPELADERRALRARGGSGPRSSARR